MDEQVRTYEEMAEEISVLKRRNLELEQSEAERERVEQALRDSEAKYHFLAESMADAVFLLDLNLVTTYVSPSIERMLGYTQEERMAQPVEQQLTRKSQVLVFETLVAELAREKEKDADPDRSLTLELEYYHKNGSIRHLSTYIRGVRDSGGNLTGIFGSHHDITDRKKAEENLRKSVGQLRRAMQTTIQVLGLVAETKDPYTAGHQKRTTDLARAMATEMGLPSEQIEGIRMAGAIHDIGKISLPTELLSKPTKLSVVEFSLIKQHAQQGYEILKEVESPWLLAEMVYQHHERIDGSGYPRGLKGDEILIEARILAVADVVESMASHRPYRPALGIDAALEEIIQNRGILYDPVVVDACLRLFREKGYKLAAA
jgi:PAS domain S-box-containing protein/putative nucleotidyltransferase with HDIG domain